MATEMRITIKKVTSSIIFLILLCSVYSVLIPSASAGFPLLSKVYECNNIVELEYDDNATQNPFLPVDRILNIPVDVKYKITGMYAEVVAEMYQERYNNFIYLYIDETPEWCSASFLPSILVVPLTASFESHAANIVVQVNENAQAYAIGTIRVRVEIDKLGAVGNTTIYQDIPFRPGYLPNLGVTTQKNLKLIGPQDTAKFDIELENLGNADTNVECKIVDKPAGWIITIDSDTIIGTGDNPTKTVYLNVKPPYEFGYHDEREVITVSITPSYFNDESLTGEEFFVSFIVQSRGFSTPGFEAIIVFFSLFTMIFLTQRLTQRKKQNSKKSSKITNKGRKR